MTIDIRSTTVLNRRTSAETVALRMPRKEASMASQPVPERDYLLGHSRPEIDRLIRQAEMLRPITERLLMRAGIERGMRVLDIGCGPGDVSLMLADLVGPTGNVLGIDPSEDAIAVARQRFRARRHTNAEFVQSDVQSYEGPAGFDAAVCRYVLIHQKDPSDFLRVTRRLIRTGGVIALHEMDAARGIRSNPRLAVLHEVYDAVHYTLTRAVRRLMSADGWYASSAKRGYQRHRCSRRHLWRARRTRRCCRGW
ncbi:class I SAM-dependent methyltransferase [Mycobacterium sp. HNNTM2301]|uniref:class I SAM-dependent methyltransferase n=1 Tax=Mycobacterium hainanense TaxID=3289775 RepID=UPI0035A73B37